MRIARYEVNGHTEIGIVIDDGIIALPQVGVASDTIDAIIAGGEEALDRIEQAVSGAAPHWALSEVRLLAPFPRPGKFLAIGMNYQKHLEEAGRLGVATPQRQLWFNKQTSCINGPFAPIDRGVSGQVDYEVELGVVIGKAAKRVGAADALDYVFGYFVVNDVSARDWQFHSPTFTMGKSFDTHGPIGPWVVTADEVPDPQNLDLSCWVNDELRQSSNTSLMLHPIAKQIEYLSTAFTLHPGDLLATGTPEGVGAGMEPPVFLQPGDRVRCEVRGIGTIENEVI